MSLSTLADQVGACCAVLTWQTVYPSTIRPTMAGLCQKKPLFEDKQSGPMAASFVYSATLKQTSGGDLMDGMKNTGLAISKRRMGGGMPMDGMSWRKAEIS